MNLRDLHLPEIGDSCTGVNFAKHTDRNGMQCTVKTWIQVEEHIKDREGVIWEPGLYFGCQWSDGQQGACGPHNLQPNPKSEVA